MIKVLISGGGTGGHIFPAVSIANEIRQKQPDAQILFVGAEGRMEMQRVPQAGYEIKGLPIRGLIRPLWSPKNIGVMLDFLKSKRMAKQIIREFQPDVAVGVGGYASSATLQAAASMGIPCLVQEQNSYAGVTNKSLAKKAQCICVAYEGMERFFPADRLILTGNPVRQNLVEAAQKAAQRAAATSEAQQTATGEAQQAAATSEAQQAAGSLGSPEARTALGLKADVPTLLSIGGSLGARTINESVLSHLDLIKQSPIQVLWQTGKYYSAEIAHRLADYAEEGEVCGCPDNLHVTDFVSDMANAYAAADLVVSRAGASSISELCLLGKASILVPSPNVAEDHQTKNARALADKNAAHLVTDAEAREKLMPLAVKLLGAPEELRSLATEVKKLAKPNAASDIADEVIKLVNR